MTLQHRPRRLRAHQALREMVAETHIDPRQLILPVFVKEGIASPQPISSLPGVWQHTVESMEELVREAVSAGLGGVMIFGVPSVRDPEGSQCDNPASILHRGVSAAVEASAGQLVVIADLCLDEFTSHGHCGVLNEVGKVDNDRTLVRYQSMAVSLAKAGAHMLGLSGMMDGQVAAVRAGLDKAGHTDTALLAYAAKYASVFYGPFRDAVESTLDGDRKSYQQDPRNRKEARREIALDLDEGADVVMVKPALSYLDVISDAATMSDVPVAAYVVSGETAMIELAAREGIVDRDAAIDEALTSVRRAGADIVCTYWALEYATRHAHRGGNEEGA
ncbi:porphobilinogen synthase [Pontimonas salivibrio]|uniref:Delta-aminolevulinic acid dehydratase n=1 Tax=Pontimonas salivibrio TaxID=1159327 RepID=A0A2L2BQ95_9MICO|nr:porphobilinogen synthase [Pontimonas salivibrio]AVG23850.1 porphobilinogen synthase [Pontimonas salivibrio]